MKIAFLSFYSGEVYRGVETFVHELSNHLVGLGFQVVVYQNGPRHKGSKYQTVSVGLPIEWDRTGGGWMPWDYWTLRVRKFTKIVLREKMDWETDVVIPMNGGWQSFYCRLWSRRNKKKLIISGQSGPGWDDKLNLWVFPDAFIGLTDYQCAWAQKDNPFVATVKISNGVDLDRFNSGIPPIKIDLPPPLILNVAALVPIKRQDLLIRAVAKLGGCSLLLVGKGQEEQKLARLGKELLGKRFAIRSFPHSLMPGVYSAADMFSFPTSPWESFGMAMLEAMGAGLPVVAADDPIRREIVGPAGLFVNPTDTAAYTAALKQALETKWGSKPRRQAAKFSWDKIALQYHQLFKGLCSQ